MAFVCLAQNKKNRETKEFTTSFLSVVSWCSWLKLQSLGPKEKKNKSGDIIKLC